MSDSLSFARSQTQTFSIARFQDNKPICVIIWPSGFRTIGSPKTKCVILSHSLDEWLCQSLRQHAVAAFTQNWSCDILHIKAFWCRRSQETAQTFKTNLVHSQITSCSQRRENTVMDWIPNFWYQLSNHESFFFFLPPRQNKYLCPCRVCTGL